MPATPERLFIGAMSGTSADGVDVALVRLSGQWPAANVRATVLSHTTVEMPPELAAQILDCRFTANIALADFCQMGHDLTLLYAQAVNTLLKIADLAPADIAAIGAHGQTLYHAPPLTLQWFDPSLLAVRTSIRVISDFRRADCAVGGQGAPLVPFADRVLFGASTPRLIVNLGGIANVTWLGTRDHWAGWDTGPANCLSDCLMQSAGKGSHDAGGAIALTGTVNDAVVQAFLNHPYFQSTSPKSTDGPAMWEAFLAAGGNQLGLPAALATAAACAAEALVRSVRTHADAHGITIPPEWAIGGGGIHNARLMAEIEKRLPSAVRLVPMESWGCHPTAREAAAFAILAAASLDGQPGNVPTVTGATQPVVLGTMTCR